MNNDNGNVTGIETSSQNINGEKTVHVKHIGTPRTQNSMHIRPAQRYGSSSMHIRPAQRNGSSSMDQEFTTMDQMPTSMGSMDQRSTTMRSMDTDMGESEDEDFGADF